MGNQKRNERHCQDLQDQADDTGKGAWSSLTLEKALRKSPQVRGRHRLLRIFTFYDVDYDQNGDSDQT